jgi:trehalose 6-phosphate synthase
MVNPYDINGMKEAILEATHAEDTDLSRRMKAMRRTVAEHDVKDWASGFLGALAEDQPTHRKQVRPARRS